MFTEILSDTAGQAALSRFATANTWPAAQTFSVAATFSAGFTSTGLGQCTASSVTTAGIVGRSSGTISANPAGYGGSNMAGQFLAAESSAFGYTMFESAGNAVGHALAFRASRGTYSARTACLSGDMLGQLDFGGYTGAGTFLNGKGVIRCVTSEAWSTTATGTQLEFYTTANTTLTPTLRLTINNAGVATFADAIVNTETRIDRAAGTLRSLLFRTSGSNRWVVQANATAEGGSNAGSDFEIRRYSDAGADLGAVISINRANGGTVFANNVTFSTQASVDGAAGTNRLMLFRTNASPRWAVYADSGAESGSNAGSFFVITRYSDAGAFIDNPIVISRSTGITQFNANKIQITTAQTPATSAAAGNAGDIAWDDTYLYVRMSTGWRRIALGAAF